MNKYLKLLSLAIIVSLAYAGISAAQSSFSIKLGTFSPKDARTGFYGALEGGGGDANVDYGLGLHIYYDSFTKSTLVGEGNIPGYGNLPQQRMDVDYKMLGLPIMAHLTVRLFRQSVFHPYGGVEGGYELLFTREKNFAANVSDNRFYHGFGAQALLGAEYDLGPTSDLLAEVFYNWATLSRSVGTNAGLPVNENFNFNGFGFRVGVRLHRAYHPPVVPVTTTTTTTTTQPEPVPTPEPNPGY